MATTEGHDGPQTDLLARMDAMQAAMLQQQEQIALQQSEIRTLKEQAAPTRAVALSASGPTIHPTARMRRLFGGRGKRLGVGLSLALLLLVAPSQSAVTHATEGTFNTNYGQGSFYASQGSHNSAFGVDALHSNYGTWNTASGDSALYSNLYGSSNTASGGRALYNNSGDYNTASGTSALYANTWGANNTASGWHVLYSNTTGINNTAVGNQAGYTDTPANANTTGSNNTFIGYNSGPGTPTQLTNATAIGANAVVSQDNSIVLGGIGANTQKVGVGTTTPHSAFQVAKGFLQIRPITGEPAAAQCATADDAGRLVVRTDGNINLYICNGTSWVGK